MKTEYQHYLIPSPDGHIEQVFRDLTNTGFALSFGDVTLVFEGGERMPFYKSNAFPYKSQVEYSAPTMQQCRYCVSSWCF